jgi:hypothetical protein
MLLTEVGAQKSVSPSAGSRQAFTSFFNIMSLRSQCYRVSQLCRDASTKQAPRNVRA